MVVVLVEECTRFNKFGDVAVIDDSDEVGKEVFLWFFIKSVCFPKKPGSNRDVADANSGLDCPDVEDDVSPPVDVNFAACFFPLNRVSVLSSCDDPVSRHTDFRFWRLTGFGVAVQLSWWISLISSGILKMVPCVFSRKKIRTN